MLESSLSPLVSPLIHNLNLPLLDVLGLGACPEEGGEAQKKTTVSAHGGDANKNDGLRPSHSARLDCRTGPTIFDCVIAKPGCALWLLLDD